MSARNGVWPMLKPWAGLVVGVIGISLAHQFGSEGTFDDCASVSPIPLLLVSAACIAAAIVAGWASYTVRREQPANRTRQLIAIISAGFAALAVFGIILPMIASLILPPCFE